MACYIRKPYLLAENVRTIDKTFLAARVQAIVASFLSATYFYCFCTRVEISVWFKDRPKLPVQSACRYNHVEIINIEGEGFLSGDGLFSSPDPITW